MTSDCWRAPIRHVFSGGDPLTPDVHAAAIMARPSPGLVAAFAFPYCKPVACPVMPGCKRDILELVQQAAQSPACC